MEIRRLVESKGLQLDPAITELRPEQGDAIEWANSRPEPYLFINAPTGSGKTLLLGGYGLLSHQKWTYLVHTIRLQEQVARTFPGLPVLTGRANHPCEIGLETHNRPDITAAEAICAAGEWCEWSGREPRKDEDGQPDPGDLERLEAHLRETGGLVCSYYRTRDAALTADYRTTNYAYYLADSRRLSAVTGVLLCDEAHNIEDAVCNHGQQQLYRRTYGRLGLRLPSSRYLADWGKWAKEATLGKPDGGRVKPDLGYVKVRRQLDVIGKLGSKDQGDWLVEDVDGGVRFTPIWGAPLVMPRLLGHDRNILDFSRGVGKAVFTSATLMGAEFIADMLGFPDGTWAYLDIPGVFPADRRPINFAPVMRMNAKTMADAAGRQKMQEAVDGLIDRYIGSGVRGGLIHAVSKTYANLLLTESRWREILTSDAVEHEKRVRAGGVSVLVAYNLVEGWDGADDLCRFIVFPKVPYATLTDARTSLRRQEDPRTYDHSALTAIVQGAGRGMRHKEDWCDTWILDESWMFLFRKRKSWLPVSFLDAYHHGVALPS